MFKENVMKNTFCYNTMITKFRTWYTRLMFY